MTQNKNIENAAKKAHATAVRVNDEAQKSELTSMMGATKHITIAKGKPGSYTLTVQFPGVARALQIRDDCRDVFGNPRRSDFLQEAIQYLIVQPKISSVDWWNTHRDIDEAINKIMDWFYDCLNGEKDTNRN